MRFAGILAALVTLGVACLPLEASNIAPDGIAISTHRTGGGDHGFGVGSSVFGNLVRHDIRAGRVEGSSVIYKGRARGACISFTGDSVAFIKLDGHLCVMSIDGSGLRELTNTRNTNASAIAWPPGDWLYYSEQGSSPDGVFNEREKDDTPDKRTIRRVNVLTGEDQLIGTAPGRIWQLSIAANATPAKGKFAITASLADFSNPSQKLNNRGMNCGTVVSMNGLYVTEMAHSHADLMIWDWNLSRMLRLFHVNEWAETPDGRSYFYRPRWAVNSDRWIVMTHGMDFGCTSQTNMVLYNWLDGRQIQVTNNAIVPEGNDHASNDEGESFWLAGMAYDFSLTGFEGEAPFSVELESEKLAGEAWRWDFGDGTVAEAPVGKHTFREPGHYPVTATRGEQVLRQDVTVLEPRKPRAALQYLDAHHLLLEFDEPVQLREAAAHLASNAPVGKLALGPLHRRLLITLGEPLPARDTLAIEGVFDLAQVPNPPAEATFPIQLPPWPTNRDGLVFFWPGDGRHSFVLEQGEGWFGPVRTNLWGRSRFDRFGATLIEGGAVFVTDGGAGISQRCRRTGQCSIEAVINPANIYQGNSEAPRRIIGSIRDGENVNFSIDQEGSNLSAAITEQTPHGLKRHRITIGPILADRPNHVLVSYRPGRLLAWIDGKQTLESAEVDGTLPWERPPFASGMHFGGRENHPHRWRGKIENVAIYSRAIDREEALQSYSAHVAEFAGRPAIQRIGLIGMLRAKADPPELADISPYRDALVVHEYDVKQITQGTYDGNRIRVAHWGLLDARRTPLTETPLGAKCPLVVEPLADHPQLEGYVMREPDENLEFVIYADVANGPTGRPVAVSLSVHPAEVWLPVGMPVKLQTTALDQYGNRVEVPLTWSVAPGGSIDAGTAYSAGQHFHDARQPGEGTVTDAGLFTGTKAGAVTVTVSSADEPELHATAIMGVGNYPAIHPAAHLPLTIGQERQSMHGDIDRLRLYHRLLSDEEIAAHARGEVPTADAGLVADWSFDKLDAGSFANSIGEGLAAEVKGEVEHLNEDGRSFARLSGKGWLEVAPDPRLNMTDVCTFELWLRVARPGRLLFRQVVWMWGLVVWLEQDSVCVDAFRTDGGALRGTVSFPKDGTWSHLAVILGPCGVWKLYADGKLIGERPPHRAPVR